MSKSIGIKLADGTFYPILEEGSCKKENGINDGKGQSGNCSG